MAETAILCLLGMPLYDSLCHAFGTLATGGFSTRTASIGAYGPAVQWVVLVFMFLAGVNFVLHFQILRGNLRAALANRELWLYTAVLAFAVLVMTGALYFGRSGDFEPGADQAYTRSGYDSLERSFRDSAFQAVSIATTTGYCTADFNRWPHICRYLLVLLMFGGACAGSTGGGIKLIRVLIAFKAGVRELRRLVRPSAVFTLRVGNDPVPADKVANTMGFLVLYFVVFLIGTVAMSLMGYDFETAFTAVLACLSNIGPGLGEVGAVEHYAHVPDLGKVLLTLCMLLGRLEIYAVLILFVPLTWKK